MNGTKTDKKSPLKNFSYMAVSKVAGDIFTLAFFVLLSRTYGQEGAGHYSFAMVYTTFFYLLSEYGLESLVVKDINQHTTDKHYIGKLIGLRISLCVLLFFIFVLSLFIYPIPQEAISIIIIVGIFQLLSSLLNTLSSIFVAHELMAYSALIEFLSKSGTAIIGLAFLLAGGSIELALLFSPVVVIVLFLIFYRKLKNKFSIQYISFDFEFAKLQLKKATPIALHNLMDHARNRTDILVISFFIGAASVGIYNAAYRIVFALCFIPMFIGIAIYPMVARAYKENIRVFSDFYTQTMNLCLLIGIPMSVGIYLLSEDIINLLYGEAFKESVIILQTLSLIIFLSFLRQILAYFLLSSGKDISWARTTTVMTALGIIFQIIALKTYGMFGVAITVLITEFLLSVFFIKSLIPIVGIPNILGRFSIALFCSAGFSIPILMLPELSILLKIVIGVLGYAILLLCFKTIRTGELKLLLNILRGQ